jgi:hypothetical protein
VFLNPRKARELCILFPTILSKKLSLLIHESRLAGSCSWTSALGIPKGNRSQSADQTICTVPHDSHHPFSVAP